MKADARSLSFNGKFDLVIMLCEGAFPLMETDEMNYQILRNAAHALKQHGKLILTTLNGLFPLFHSVKDFIDSQKGEGNAMIHRSIYEMILEFERILSESVPAEHWDDSGLWRWTVINTVNEVMLGRAAKGEMREALSWHPALDDILSAYEQATSGHW